MREVSEQVTVARRFHGPPHSGNGGYACGLAAHFIGGPAEVSLLAPPPLGTPLDVIRDGEAVILRHGERDIARARAAMPEAAPPPAPSFADAQAAEARYRGHVSHIFPSCFVCGPQSPDGLRLFTGPLAGSDHVASSWIPGADLAGADGAVADEFIWAALDCPTYWALPQSGTLGAVLGRLTAEIVERPKPGEHLVLAAWPRGEDGRKHYASGALYGETGRLYARADAIWIALKQKPENPA